MSATKFQTFSFLFNRKLQGRSWRTLLVDLLRSPGGTHWSHWYCFGRYVRTPWEINSVQDQASCEIDCGWHKGFWENSDNEGPYQCSSSWRGRGETMSNGSCSGSAVRMDRQAFCSWQERRGKHHEMVDGFSRNVSPGCQGRFARCIWMCWNLPKRQQTEIEVGRGSMPCPFNVWRVVERTTNEFWGSSHLEIAFIAPTEWWQSIKCKGSSVSILQGCCKINTTCPS